MIICCEAFEKPEDMAGRCSRLSGFDTWAVSRKLCGVKRILTTGHILVADCPDGTGTNCRMIELNRPAKLNCLNLEMLDDVLSSLEGGKTGRVVLTGAGRAFCTGLDLAEVAGPDGGRRQLQRLVAIYRWLLNNRGSTVVLAAGCAMGGGAGLVACAGTVIVSDDFCFRLPGGKLSRLASVVLPVCNLRTGGKSPGETGWLGCNLNAEDARRLGLVDRVVSRGELDELIEAARTGRMSPGLFQPDAQNEEATGVALAELDQFLQALER